MVGEIPPITPPPAIPPKPDGLFLRLWNAIFPGAAISDEPAGNEGVVVRTLFRPWSLPFKVALFVTAVLLGVIFFYLWEFNSNPYHVPWRYSLTTFRIAAVALMLLVIPLSVFQALRMWLNVEKSPFPDINAAWQAGIEALRKQGLTIGDKPLFLVLGSVDEHQERMMFEASNRTFLISGVPEGPAPMHWYVNADRIILSCTGVGWLSALSALIVQREQRRGSAVDGDKSSRQANVSKKVQDLFAELSAKDQVDDAGRPRSAPPAKAGEGYKTISFWSMEEDKTDEELGTGSVFPTAAPAFQEQSLAIIQPSDAAEQTDRLEAVCELLRSARHPYSPINGCITLIPFAIAGIDQQEVEEMAKAVSSDLNTLHKTLRVRYPVTTIFTGMESEPGFRELMRRVGPERCAAKRFGMGYDLRAPASSSEIGSFATHVCGVFEDWVYGLFRDDQSLKRPGNSSLFSLLCRVRSSFKDRLSILLSQGYGYSDRLDPDDVSFLFSGCYFVATGGTKDKQAFIQGISEKLEGQQDQLEWSREAIQSDRRFRRLSVVATSLIVCLLSLLIYLIIYHPFWNR